MKKRKKDTGLSLQASISEKEKRTVTSGFLAIVPVCYMILGVFGWMKTALGIINVVYDADLLYGVLLAAGIWMGILYLMKKRQFLLLLLTLAVTPILVWMRFSVILEGFSEISRVFQSGMTVPGGVYQGIGSEYEITCALIVVVFLLYDLFFICLSTEIGKYLAVLLLVLPFCAAFVFGQVPDGMGTFCMLLCALGLIASSAEEHDRQRNGSAFFLGILSLLLLLIGFSAGKSLLEPLFEGKEQTRARIQQTSFIKEIEKWTAPLQSQMPQIASGGVSEGTINDADFFLNTGEVLFSVSQDQQPQGSLYLKVYTGTKYSNTRWKANDDPEEKAEIFCQRAAAWSNTQGYDGAVRLTVGFPQGKSDASHPYAPYFSQGMSDDGTEKKYRYYPIERIAYLFTEPADSLTDDYRDYVYQHYLDYPTKGTERMQQFVADNPGADIEEICNIVRTFLDESAVYNPQVGRFPKNQNFTEYFLFEKHEGYCVHFATAAVLLMRMYGIPARYATGFAIPAADFDWQDGAGWLANVEDSRSHAWAEIYTDYYGWIPFETTPSYDSGADLSYYGESPQEKQQQSEEVASRLKTQQTESMDTEDGTQNNDKNNEQTPDTRKQNADQSSDSDSKNGYGANGMNGSLSGTQTGIVSIAAVLLSLIFAGLILFARRTIRLRRRSGENAQEIFRDFYEVLVFAGMPQGLDCMKDGFTAKVCEQFQWLNKEELDQAMDIVMRANFAGDPVTKEETMQLKGLYRYTCRMALKGMSRKKKFLFRFIKAYA